MSPEDPIKHLDVALKKGLKSLRSSTIGPVLPAPPKLEPPAPSAEEIRSGRTCYRKTKYATAQLAKNRLNINEAETPGLKLYIYKCASCHHWHLTRTKP